ncbi:MAG: NAD-dependent epimerase/dehydratase family protein [Bacilli bacterium]
MKILVTGATGRVGSRLVPHLLQRGDTLRVLVRNPESAAALQAQGADIACGDLTDTGSLAQAVADMDAIVHLAAFFRGATPEQTLAVNLDGAIAMARAAFDEKAPRFVFASTTLVYGPGQGGRFREQDPPHPASAYPKNKLAAEQALLALHQTQGLALRILRLSFVYGDGDPHLTEGLRWFRNWNPTQEMHMVHHADVAQAFTLALDTDGIDGQIYNVGDDEPASAGDIMHILDENIAPDAASRPIDPAFQQLVDTSKIRHDLGFRPIYPTLHDAVAAGVL